jgi:hypothetical protein
LRNFPGNPSSIALAKAITEATLHAIVLIAGEHAPP